MSHFPKYVSDEYRTTPLQPIAAGKTGQPEVLTSGGAKAVGKIVFTGNLVANDTVTVNGVVFTCKASGATGELEFNVDASLSASLDALITKLNACTDPLVSYATYTKTDANTAVTSTADSYGTANNSPTRTLASTHSTVVVTQPAGGLDSVSASLDTEHTQIDFASAITADIYLPDGDESQRKTIAMVGLGTANIISANDKLPGTTNNYAMNGDDVLVLQWLGGKWRLILNDGAVAS